MVCRIGSAGGDSFTGVFFATGSLAGLAGAATVVFSAGAGFFSTGAGLTGAATNFFSAGAGFAATAGFTAGVCAGAAATFCVQSVA